MPDIFDTAFDRTMIHEGGYSFDKIDPGGETYCGISRVYWPGWSGWQVIDQAIEAGRRLENVPELPTMVKKFYREQFWNRFRGDDVAELTPGVAMELFDSSVTLGVRLAVSFLQEALNLLNVNGSAYHDLVVDGFLGPVTMVTLKLCLDCRPLSKKQKEKMMVNIMNTLQGMHYIEQMRKYPQKERFRGWFLRI